MSTVVNVAKVVVLALWAGGLLALFDALSKPFDRAFLIVLMVGIPAHLVEAALFARRRGLGRVRGVDLVNILVFGGPHLMAIKLREEGSRS
jgi:uncharacterized protein YhhL (DUF1145 family)